MTISKFFSYSVTALGTISMFLLTMIFNTLQQNRVDIQDNAVQLAKIEQNVENIDQHMKRLESNLERQVQSYAYVENLDEEQ